MTPNEKYEDGMKQIREHFAGNESVTHKEISQYCNQTGIRLPREWAEVSRVSRGVFNLHIVKKDTPEVNHKPNTSAATQNHFDREKLIPTAKDTYVEWGNYKTVLNLVKSNKFFTLYVTGDSGSGKNEMISQVCATLNRPMVRVAITRDTKEEHLIGSKTLVDGNIVYEEGPVVWAAKNGAVLLCDEISAGDANELMCLQNVMEGNEFFVKSANMMVTPVPGFCVIATDNTKGRGSDSGRYIGTNILNDAFLERFEMTMEQGYPTEKIERSIIEKLMAKEGMDEPEFANRLVEWVQAIRKTYVSEGLDEQITTRRACHIVRTYEKLKDANKAIELCVNRFDETTKMAMLSLWEKMTPGQEAAIENPPETSDELNV